MKKLFHIAISMMLALLMVVSSISPVVVSAEGVTTPSETDEQQENVSTDDSEKISTEDPSETNKQEEELIEEEEDSTSTHETTNLEEINQEEEQSDHPNHQDSANDNNSTVEETITNPEILKEEEEQAEEEVIAENVLEETLEDGEEVSYTITSEGSMGDFIANYLSPYFGNPAIIKEEHGKKYAYITLSGKAYGFTEIQVVKADGTKEDVEILSEVGEGINQVRVIKFEVEGTTTDLFVDGGTYGQYTITLDFELDNSEPETPVTPTEPETQESKVETTWFYKEKIFDVSKFLNTTVTVKEVNGEKRIVIDSISEIITDLKVNGESLTIAGGVAEFEIEDLSDITATISYKVGERAMSHDFSVTFKEVNTAPTKPEVKEFKVATTWFYKEKEFDVSKFLNTTATVKEVNGEKKVVIDSISEIITNLKVNGESLTIAGGVAEFKVADLSDITATISYKAGERAMSHDFTVTFKEVSTAPSEPETPVTSKEEEVLYTITSAGSMGNFIANYLSPYFGNPAIIKEENGKKYAYLTLSGKAYGFTEIQVVKADGMKENVEILSAIGEGINQVRVIKFEVEGTTTDLFVDGGTYGQYTIKLDFELDNSEPETPVTPTEPEAQESKVETTWFYKEEVFDVSKFLNTTATVKEVNGEKRVVIDSISSIITDLKVNGESLTIAGGVAEFKVADLSDIAATISYKAGERAMSHDFTVTLKEVSTAPTEPETPVAPSELTTPSKPSTPVEDSTELKDGDYTIKYEFLSDGTNESSIMNEYVHEVANLKVEDGKKYIEIKFFKSSLITEFKVNGSEPEVVSSDKKNDTKIVRFRVFDLEEKQEAWVKVDYPEINYHHEYTIQIEFDVDSIQKATSKDNLESVVKNPNPPEQVPEVPVTQEKPKVELKEGQYYNTDLIFGGVNEQVKEYLENKVGIRVEQGKFKVTLLLKNSSKIESIQVKNKEGSFVEMETIEFDEKNDARKVEFEASDVTEKIEARMAIKKDSAQDVQSANVATEYTDFEFSLNTTAIQEGILNMETPILTESVNGLADGEYAIDFEFLTDGTDSPSMMNTYVHKTATLKVINGEQFILLTVLNSNWVTGFKIEQNGVLVDPTIISDNQKNNHKVVQFKVEDLEKKLNAWVKVDVENINYHHDYALQLVFDLESIKALDRVNSETEVVTTEEEVQTESKEENASNAGINEQEVSNGTDYENVTVESRLENLSFNRGTENSSATESNKESHSSSEGTNPRTSDLTELGLYIFIFTGSLILLARRYRMNSRIAK